jgi:hypothetical protein
MGKERKRREGKGKEKRKLVTLWGQKEGEEKERNGYDTGW